MTVWEVALLTFGGAFGSALGVTMFFDSRLRELRARVAKLEYEARQSLQRQEFLIALMQRNNISVPAATEINIGAGGEMNVGGDVAGRDKITSSPPKGEAK